MQNNPKAPMFMIELHAMFVKEIKGLQQAFVDTFVH